MTALASPFDAPSILNVAESLCGFEAVRDDFCEGSAERVCVEHGGDD